jgi:hypothetical protein
MMLLTGGARNKPEITREEENGWAWQVCDKPDRPWDWQFADFSFPAQLCWAFFHVGSVDDFYELPRQRVGEYGQGIPEFFGPANASEFLHQRGKKTFLKEHTNGTVANRLSQLASTKCTLIQECLERIFSF